MASAIGAAIRHALPTENEPHTATETRDIPTVAGPAPTCNPRPPPQTPPAAQTTDITLQQRAEIGEETKAKFRDIFEVHPVCDDTTVDLDSFDDTVNVRGRLHLPESIEFFKKIGASDFILNTLKNGHYPKLKSPVPDYEIENHGSFLKHHEFAIDTISSLLSKGRIEIVEKRPKLVNPLHVVVQRLKNRLILDCSKLNEYIIVPKIKYENHEVAFQFFKKGVFMFSYDLKDGYHHLLIHPEFRDYLGFKLMWNGKLTYFRYVVGCFGLADLPFIYTKIYRPLVAHWRSFGIPIIKFLDDGGFFVNSFSDALNYVDHVKKDLIRSGSIYSKKKCIWAPTQVMTWLGFTWNSINGTVAAADHRVEKIKSTCSTLLSMDTCSVRQLAGFVGQIISLTFVAGNCCQITTKQSQIAIASSRSWDESILITNEIKRELLFWRENLDALNCRSCLDKGPPKVMNVIEGDASSSGCGSILNRQLMAARIFSPDEREMHSTFRELANVHFSINAFLNDLKNSSVKFLIDSQSAARILETGSMKPDMQWFATEIFFLCFNNNISLKVEWIPREQNQEADWASREADIIDIEDWGITKAFFSIINNLYGPFTIDAFANFYNSKCPRFYSLFHTPGSTGVDALSYNWHGENVLLVPPVNAIGKALAHLRICKAKGVLVAPKWKSSFFWPLLKNNFSKYISDFRTFKGSKVLQHGLNKNSLLGSPSFSGDVIAVCLDCTEA